MNTIFSYIALIFGVFSILLGVYQFKIWLALIKRGVKVQTTIIDTFKDNDRDDCFIVSFIYEGQPKEFKLYEPDDSKKINDSIICIFDPLTEKLEIDTKWNMPIKVFGPIILGVSFIWAGINTIKLD